VSADFRRDDLWQRAVRDRLLVPFYRGRRERFVLLDGDGAIVRELQRRGVDTLVQADDGGVLSFEEKIVRWRGRAYDAIVLETQSCTTPGYESAGWIRMSQADRLLYAFQTEIGGLDILDILALRAWFAPREQNFPSYGPLATLNATEGRVVPIAAILENVPARRHAVLPRQQFRSDEKAVSVGRKMPASAELTSKAVLPARYVEDADRRVRLREPWEWPR
jgi:hypothetical protein